MRTSVLLPLWRCIPLLPLLAAALLTAPCGANAAAMAAADQAGGYADQVLDKVSRLWNPPADPADRKVRIKISIDGDGKVLKCEPVASSALASMDKAACAAVREAASFGAPPYGLPIDVYMTLWTGKPVPQPLPPAGEAAAPAAPGKTPVSQMTVHASKADAAAESPETKYVNSVMAKISPHVALPPKLADGKYTVVVQVRVSGQGQIIQVNLTRSCGNAEVDTAIMRAVTRTSKVGVPPGKNTQDLNLTFVVQKP